ncbi:MULTISPECIES: type II toxin-antitoxin system Phd/YefM family antitoxin [Acidiphilium]|uniref:type II toxin-antitoxin system Phd/YefM family antitoxin n=1 Tax=Acidiphilium TaxID=522 RepID=UPI00257E22A2|nr:MULTISPECIES: hypothetical protein [Acidiphilium]HQT85147.1 hypothetical protein [Acidiphilium rubrum]
MPQGRKVFCFFFTKKKPSSTAQPPNPQSTAAFKAKCLDILDRVANREFDTVTITKRGRVVAILSPPASEASAVHALHGFMRDSVIIPHDIDLTDPIAEDDCAAAHGILHN